MIPTTHASLILQQGMGAPQELEGMSTGDWICGHFCIYDWVCIAGSKKGGMAGEVKHKKDIHLPIIGLTFLPSRWAVARDDVYMLASIRKVNLVFTKLYYRGLSL